MPRLAPKPAHGGNGKIPGTYAAPVLPAQGHKKSLGVVSLADWLEQEIAETNWLLEPLLPDDALIMLSGQQKRAQKTWMADACAIAIASGVSVGPLVCSAPGKVCYIEEEGTLRGTKYRILGICQTYGVDVASLANVDFVFRRGVKLDDSEWRQVLIDHVRATKPRLVILDALTYMHDGDENSIKDMQPVVETLKAIRAEGPSVLFLTHTNQTRGEDPNSDIDLQVRGSSIFANLYDTHLGLRRYDMESPTAELRVRSRDGGQEDYIVRWVIEGDKSTREVFSATLTIVDKEGMIQQASTMALASMDTTQQYGKKQLAAFMKLDKKDVDTTVDYMIEKQLVEKTGTRYKRTSP